MSYELRDHREERDWTRIWRDPPGWWRCCCSCAGLTPVFTDDFGGSLTGYTATLCGATGENHVISGGHLLETYAGAPYTGAGGAYTQAITIPALDGLCISVQANIYAVTGKVTGTTGVVIGSAAILLGRYQSPTPFATKYLSNRALSSGCSAGSTVTFGAANENFDDGDLLKILLKDVSAGGGTYDIESYVNGVLLDTRSAVSISLTAGGTIVVGVFDTNGGEWDNLSISTT